MPMPRVLVVGAGATGACAALRLRQLLGREVQIEVWEKARGPGGRMSTNRQALGGATVRADLGAQYLSLDGEDPASAGVAELLVKAGVCAEVPAALLSATPERPAGKGWRHLAGTAGGVNDALKAILEESGAELHCEKRVASLDEQQGQWRARPFEGAPGLFSAVVLAVPGCGVGGDNLNKIHGGYEGKFSKEQWNALVGAQHDARWAFALFLSAECQARCEEYFGPTQVEKVVDAGPVHLLCYQSRKTAELSGDAPAGAIAVVAHTTIEWAKRNARANGRDDRLLQEVAEHVKGLLGITAPLSRVLLASKVITWKQCQVTKHVPPPRNSGPCMLVSERPAMVLAGDYFTESNFSGCLKSAFAAAEAVAGLLSGGPTAALADRAERASMKGSPGDGGKGSKDGKGGKGGKGGKDAEAGKVGGGGKGGKGSKGSKGYPAGTEGDEKRGGGGKGKGKGYAWQPMSGA